ncbi:MAG: helix-turn-helix domain-containing protein [Bacteroidetes bacterium]|nr:helix-turn-helix domain-containing protein [Bacteroidota bacterium]MBS1629671.1 helix-turn-helix domain-containing protein [Bacteroidota bacterium]
MELLTPSRPSKAEQQAAAAATAVFAGAIAPIKGEATEIEIEETGQKVTVPVRALVLMRTILEAMSKGQPISVVPVATELTTQVAAEMLGCSRPHLVKLLEEGIIPYTKVGKHRRLLYEDVLRYRQEQKAAQKQYLKGMMAADEEDGLYDS